MQETFRYLQKSGFTVYIYWKDLTMLLYWKLVLEAYTGRNAF